MFQSAIHEMEWNTELSIWTIKKITKFQRKGFFYKYTLIYKGDVK